MSDICTEDNLEQPSKALSPILVTLLGIVTEDNLEQPLKALSPILVTLLGIVTEDKPEQPWKAKLPIPFTVGPIIYLVTCEPKMLFKKLSAEE